ncbi:MAG TPA: type IV pilus secretin PilQ [Burkholderiales bacterium]|nr:type IV pilus secretin PilQ [Burkholderiales bacterium]
MMRSQPLLATFFVIAAALPLSAAVCYAQNDAKAPAPGVSPAPADAAAGAPTQPAAATNALEGLDVSTDGGKVVIKLKLKEPLAGPPASFSLINPPRVAFDLPNTVNALGKNSQDVNESDVKSVRIGESGGRTRVVLNLSRTLKYTAAADGRTVVIGLEAAASASTVAPAERTHFAESKPTAQPHSVRNIDFKRGRNGDGQVIIDLSDAGTGIDLKQQGRSITIDLFQTELPLALERRFDVTDFGTPVESMEVTSQGKNARIVIQARGRWEQSAQQTDNRLIIDVKPITEQQAKQKAGYTGEKLSLNFQNVEVRAVLQVIADFTGLNIITSDTVSGNLTLRLKDVPWDQALDIILQAKGLDMRKTGNVVWIAPRDELATKEKLALEAQQQIADLEPLRTESFQLNYQKADALQKLLSDPNQKVLSKRGSAVTDPRTNTLFVQDTPSKLEEVRALIKQIDVAVRQVLIESRIVEAQDTFNKNLGARLGFFTPPVNTGAFGNGLLRAVPGGNTQSIGVQTGQAQNYPQSFFPDSYSVNLPAQNILGNAVGQFGLTLFNAAATRFLNLEISALQSDEKGKIISSPRVITGDNIEADIEQGTEIPYLQASSSGATSASFRKAVLSLKVKPQITPDDNVIMNLEVHKDAVGANTTAGPSIDTKQVTTQVLVENGGTVSIGGIYQQTQDQTIVKVPMLGDIPIIGQLFKTTSTTNDRRELLIFVTPKILRENLTSR